MAEQRYRYRPALFFALAFIATWIPWLIGAAFARHEAGEAYGLVFNLIGLFLGPAGVALAFIFLTRNEALRADFRARLLNIRLIRPAYAVVAVVVPFMIILLAILISTWFGESPDQASLAAGALPLIALAMLLAPILEETGWHGYGVDSLRAHMGMLQTTAVFALLWCLWHLPLIIIPGTYQNYVATLSNKLFVFNFFVSIIPAAFFANWLYYRNRRSIAGAILVHSMLNGSAVLINAGQIAKCIATGLYIIMVLAIIVFDRDFRNGSRYFFAQSERS